MLLTLQLQQLLLPRLQLQLQLHHITLHCANCTAVRNNYKKKCSCDYTTLHNNTLHQLHYITVHYNYYSATLQLQLQLPHTTPLHTTPHPAVVWEVTHSKKHNSNHLSVHQWVRSAIHASQQLTSVLSLKLPPPALCGTTGMGER